jgi:hypothetical protein
MTSPNGPTWHDPIEVVPGDDLVIVGNLTDTNGALLDLTDAVLEYVLVGPDGEVAASYPGTAAVTVWDPPAGGNLTVIVDRDVTEGLAIGRYSDSLRVTTADGQRSTFWRGTVLVDAAPPWPPLPAALAVPHVITGYAAVTGIKRRGILRIAILDREGLGWLNKQSAELVRLHQIMKRLPEVRAWRETLTPWTQAITYFCLWAVA